MVLVLEAAAWSQTNKVKTSKESAWCNRDDLASEGVCLMQLLIVFSDRRAVEGDAAMKTLVCPVVNTLLWIKHHLSFVHSLL